MGYNIFEKIILNNSSKKELKIGEIVTVEIDKVMIHDFFAPFCIDQFYDMGFKKVWNSEKVVFIYDHLVPIVKASDNYHHQKTEQFIMDQYIKNVYRSDGVCHQLMPEEGHTIPGKIILGTDSHTVTYGGVGALATGIGYTEMAAVLGTGRMWLKVVPVIKIEVNGKFVTGVYAKDLILKVLSDLKVDGGNYKVIEFTGETIRNMSISERLTLCNMTVEIGAKAGIVEPDEKVLEYYKDFGIEKDSILELRSDEDAAYEKVLHYDANELTPLVACPYNVDNVKKVSDLSKVSINQAFIGSCTNGRLEDLKIASNILEGKKIVEGVRLIVIPASRKIFKEAMKRGYITNFLKAGAIVNHPSCGLCCGISGGLLENGEKIISTNNRNFYGRMGENAVEIYLASPATVAKSALDGFINNEYLTD